MHDLKRILPQEIEIRNKLNGCGTSFIVEITTEDIGLMKKAFNNIDVEFKHIKELNGLSKEIK